MNFVDFWMGKMSDVHKSVTRNNSPDVTTLGFFGDSLILFLEDFFGGLKNLKWCFCWAFCWGDGFPGPKNPTRFFTGGVRELLKLFGSLKRKCWWDGFPYYNKNQHFKVSPTLHLSKFTPTKIYHFFCVGKNSRIPLLRGSSSKPDEDQGSEQEWPRSFPTAPQVPPEKNYTESDHCDMTWIPGTQDSKVAFLKIYMDSLLSM